MQKLKNNTKHMQKTKNSKNTSLERRPQIKQFRKQTIKRTEKSSEIFKTFQQLKNDKKNTQKTKIQIFKISYKEGSNETNQKTDYSLN